MPNEVMMLYVDISDKESQRRVIQSHYFSAGSQQSLVEMDAYHGSPPFLRCIAVGVEKIYPDELDILVNSDSV